MISRKRLREFAGRYPDAAGALGAWYRSMTHMNFTSFSDLRRTFGTADKVGSLTVFDIGGNRYRLIAAVHYNRRRVYVRHVLTHAEYDRGGWQR